MKKHLVQLVLLATVSFGLPLTDLDAQSPSSPSGAGQMGKARPGPDFSGYLAQLFADNPAFTASLDFHSYAATSDNAVTAQGKLAYLNGKTRFEMDITNAGDANLPAQDASTLAQLGMDTMIAISRPQDKVNYFVYPGMMAYVRRPASAPADYKLETTEVGAENVQGQNCVKNKVVATGPDGVARESTVWNATDLNNFPIKIETVQNGATVVMLFRDLNLEGPDAALFNPPANYKQYNDFMSLMTNRAGRLPPQ